MDNRRPKWEQRALHQLSRAALLLMVALVQTELAPDFWHVRINVVLVVVACWTLLRGVEAGMRWALYGGLALGLLTPLPLGAHLLSLALVVLVIGGLAEAYPRDNLLVPTLCVVGGSILESTILALVQRMGGTGVNWSGYLWMIMLPETLLNVLVALPLYMILRGLDRRDRRRGWVA